MDPVSGDAYKKQIEDLMESATRKMQGAAMVGGASFNDLINEEQLKGLAQASVSMAAMVHCLVSMGIESGAAVYLVAEYSKALLSQVNKIDPNP